MSEGYQCDRCYTTKPGKPELTLAVGEGIERVRIDHAKDEFRGKPGGKEWGAVQDLCPACRNDLRRWWAEPQGDGTLLDGGPKEDGIQ
jgi:hypothetical protein